MDGIHKSELSSVYHEAVPDDGALAEELWEGNPPRLFALVQEDYGEDDSVIHEVVAYGIALPSGSATTFLASGEGIGRWISPESASRRLDSELIWVRR